LAIIVHKSNPVQNLTLAELRQYFPGRAKSLVNAAKDKSRHAGAWGT
jgi:hypothetical protein